MLIIAFACIAASAETQADEGGASFWLPGQFGRIETSVSARTNLLFITPTYTFSDSVLGDQAAISITETFGRNDVSAEAALAGPNGNILSRNDRSSLTGIGDLFPFVTIRWNEGNHNFMTYTMFGVPVGNYQVGHLTNLGINQWQ